MLHHLFDRNLFLGALCDYLTSAVECRSYLHPFPNLPVTQKCKILGCWGFFLFWGGSGGVGVFICLGFFLCSPTLSAVARSYYLFPFMHCNVPARSVPEFTAPGSAAPSDIVVLALVGSSCLDQYHGQRSPHQLLQDEFSKSTSAPRNADPSEWKRGWV